MATNTGHPNESLYKVLDGIRGDVDDEFGKKDLKRYTEEYDWRARNGDVGGHFTPQNRAYVQHLMDNWDSPDVVRLRGTYTAQDNNSRGYYGDQNTRQVANSTISGKSLRAAAGLSSQGDLYTLYRKGS